MSQTSSPPDPESSIVPDESLDPLSVLEVAADADERTLHAAYLSKVRQFPPDRHPEAFERICAAYEELRDPLRRAERFLLSVQPMSPFVNLVETGGRGRQYVGPDPWLALFRERVLDPPPVKGGAPS